MDTERLERMEDVTRRYGTYRPCGAGLGVIWGGVLLGALGLLLLQWTLREYAEQGAPAQTLWRFMRDSQLTPPWWLQAAAMAAPFVAWTGLVAIQAWVDRQFGAVTVAGATVNCRRTAPRWFAPTVVAMLACLLSGVLVWDARGDAVRGVVALLAIAGWAVVWGRSSRDQLTLLVMLAVSIPSLYVLAASDPHANFTAGNLVIFAAYLLLMVMLLLQGIRRFHAFLQVRADLNALRPVEE
jgi:hypothetical protein